MAGEYTRSAAPAQSGKLLRKSDTMNVTKEALKGRAAVAGRVASPPFAVSLEQPNSLDGRLTRVDYQVRDEEVRVLFVEDDPAVAQMYKLKLELDGYAVTVAPDGEAGLKMAKESRPDMIFLDIRLPKMDGFAVLEELRRDADTKDIPVVILSNYSEQELVERGLNLGALEYLIKSETTPAKLSKGVEGWRSETTETRGR